MPVSTLINVVLPAPFGPMTEKMRPAGISSDTDCTACTPPKFFDRPSMARIVGVIGRALFSRRPTMPVRLSRPLGRKIRISSIRLPNTIR